MSSLFPLFFLTCLVSAESLVLILFLFFDFYDLSLLPDPPSAWFFLSSQSCIFPAVTMQGLSPAPAYKTNSAYAHGSVTFLVRRLCLPSWSCRLFHAGHAPIADSNSGNRIKYFYKGQTQNIFKELLIYLEQSWLHRANIKQVCYGIIFVSSKIHMLEI